MKKATVFLMATVFMPLQLINAAPNVLRTDTGFYYPANKKYDNVYYGYGERSPNVGDRCHLALDYKLAEGKPVYAAGEGVVTKASMEIPSYGSDTGSPGGVIIIKHETDDGRIFYGFYGHVKNLAVQVGDTVSGGQKIADVGRYLSNNQPLSHLHFAISPTPPSYQGYTPTPACTDLLGFVDPEVYLESHTAKTVPADTCDAADDAATTTKNTIVTIGSVLTNDTDTDGDTLSVSLVEDSTQGVVVTNNNDGTLTYTPPIDFEGTDSFFYTMTDNNGCSDRATVNVIVGDGGNGDGGNGGNGGDGGTNNPDDTTPPKSSSGGGSIASLGLFSLLSLALVRAFRRRKTMS